MRRYNKLYENQGIKLTKRIKDDSSIYWQEFISFLNDNNDAIEW